MTIYRHILADTQAGKTDKKKRETHDSSLVRNEAPSYNISEIIFRKRSPDEGK